MKRICTICARAESKGLPGKNLRHLAGKTLVALAVEQAKETGLFDAVAVSSDSEGILAEGRAAGADHVVQRPDELATDDSSKHGAICHCVREVEDRTGVVFDVVVDLDLTSALRLPEDIIGAVGMFEREGVSNVITGATARKNPYFNLVERNGDGHVELAKALPSRLQRRQDCPPCFDMNAAVYVWRRETYMASPDVFYDDTLIYEMPAERSWDIDTPLDFDWVEFLMNRRQTL